jgi:hypothetical protein
MERNTLFVKIYKVINDDKTEKILETEKKTVDHASISLKWNEIPIIDSKLKLDDVLEFDLYKLKRSIVYPLGREYHLAKICVSEQIFLIWKSTNLTFFYRRPLSIV